MNGETLRAWRRQERVRLVEARLAVPPDTLERWRHSIDSLIERAFPDLHAGVLGFCWPIRNEYDARPLALRLLARGGRAALPANAAPGQALRFREWRADTPMEEGSLGIPAPVGSHARELHPDTLLVPLVGWDESGYRLGYGGGFMDRTLAARPGLRAIGVGYELGRLPSIGPQPWDVPMSFVATERALYRRENARLKLMVGS